MLRSDNTIFSPFEMVAVSDNATKESKILAMTWPRDMADQSEFAVFHIA